MPFRSRPSSDSRSTRVLDASAECDHGYRVGSATAKQRTVNRSKKPRGELRVRLTRWHVLWRVKPARWRQRWEWRRVRCGKSGGEGLGEAAERILKKLRGVIVTIPPARSLFPLRDAETLLAASSSGHAQDDDSSNATLYFGHAERHIAPCLPSRLHDVAKHTMSGPRRPQMFVASTSHFLLPSRIAGVGWLFHIKPPAGVPVHAESVYLLRIVLSATMPVETLIGSPSQSLGRSDAIAYASDRPGSGPGLWAWCAVNILYAPCITHWLGKNKRETLCLFGDAPDLD